MEYFYTLKSGDTIKRGIVKSTARTQAAIAEGLINDFFSHLGYRERVGVLTRVILDLEGQDRRTYVRYR